MDNNISTNPTDVNQTTDTTTAGGSSTTQQTPVDTSTQNNSGQATGNGTNAIPYDRFKEVNDTLKATQAELKAIREARMQQQNAGQNGAAQANQLPNLDPQSKEQLTSLIKGMGFVSKEEIQQQELVRQVDSEHSRLEQKYNGKDGLPKYDKQAVLDYAISLGITSAKGLEIAYKQMHEAEIMQARIQKAMTQTRGVASERSNGTGSANAGVSNQDLLKAAQGGDKNAARMLIRRSREA